MKTITLIPGDGIGPEVTHSAIKVIQKVTKKGDKLTHDLGGDGTTTEITEKIIDGL